MGQVEEGSVPAAQQAVKTFIFSWAFGTVHRTEGPKVVQT